MANQVYETIEDFSGRRLQKLERIRQFFVWPMAAWLVIVFIDFANYVLDIRDIGPIREFVELFAYYSFPVILIYVAIVTFYSSYRVLGSRGHKNVIVFFLVQMFAAFFVAEVGLEIPSIGQRDAVILTFSIAIAIVVVVILVQGRIVAPQPSYVGARVSIRNDRPGLDSGEGVHAKDQSEPMGMVIAGLFSLVIAAMIYFRVRDGISFVPWGVFFGVLSSGIILNSDKLILSILFFLDPRGAVSLYHLIKLKEDVERERQRSEVEVEVGTLRNQERRTRALQMANELDQELKEATFQRGERDFRNLIDSLRTAKNLSPEQLEDKIAEAENYIGLLRQTKQVPHMLPEADYSGLSNEEKMARHVGLAGEELEEAVAEGLIDPAQKFIWRSENQFRIRTAREDFSRNRVRGAFPVYLAESWSEYFEGNRLVLEKLVTSIAGEEALQLTPIKGADALGLMVLEFNTIANRYCAVIAEAQSGGFLVYGVFEVPRLAQDVKA